MNSNLRYTLGKQERLKSRKSIDLLFKEGNSFNVFPFKVLYLFDGEQPSARKSLQTETSQKVQAGFTVSSRNFKKAVERNRVRRLMKEAYRLQKNDLYTYMASRDVKVDIFFLYLGKEVPEYKLAYEKMGIILNRLTKLISDRK